MTFGETITWVNGRLGEPGRADLSSLDHGFTVGDGVFETLKVSSGVPFALTRHLARLARSAASLGLQPPDESQLRLGIEEVLRCAAQPSLARLRLTVTAGVGPLGSDRLHAPQTLAVALAPAGAQPASAAVVTVPWPRNERAATVGVKTTSYAENVVALSYAREHGADEAILSNTIGELCEGTGSNIFIVRDGLVCTPGLSSGCLAGITRELLLEWSGAAGLDIRQRPLTMVELEDCDEAALSSSTRDIQPIHRINGRELRAPGRLSRQL
ncbi:MAG: aminotransferase class IV, partial [Angustibacter sp.]